MSTLYGKVDLGNPERQEFFGETRKQLQQYINLQDAEKAAEEKAMQDAGDVPPLSSVGLYQRDFDAAQQMANILKDKKSDMLNTEEGRRQYQRGLDELSGFLSDRKTYYNTTHPILVQNTSLKKSGINPDEWEAKGLMDGRTLEQYIAKTAELDTNRFNVKFDNGSFVLADQDGDHASNDPSLMDLSFFEVDNYLVQTPADSPSVWYTTHKPRNDGKFFKDEKDAKEWTRATIMSGGGKGKRDAVRWFVNSDKNTDGLTADQIDSDETGNALDRAVDAYAEEAVSGWEKFVEKSKDDKKESKGALSLKGASDDYNELINIEDNYGGYDSTEMKVTDPETGSQTVVPAFTSTYNFLGKAKKASPEISLDEFEGSSKISSISYDTFTSSWKITLSDGSESEFNRNPEDEGRFYVPGMRDERGGRVSKMKHFANQFDAVHGDGSFTALLSQLQTKAKKELTF